METRAETRVRCLRARRVQQTPEAGGRLERGVPQQPPDTLTLDVYTAEQGEKIPGARSPRGGTVLLRPQKIPTKVSVCHLPKCVTSAQPWSSC